MLTPENLAALGGFVLANFAAASSGAVFRPGAWYAGLAKPPWTPPNIAFPIVWTILFVLNAVAGWLAWLAGGMDAAWALALYGASLVVNASWSAVFFGLRRMGLAFGIVLTLWVSIVGILAAFAPFSAAAAWMLAPYLVWVTIASALNLRVWQLNPQARVAV
jgi:benzodiazapine receptor